MQFQSNGLRRPQSHSQITFGPWFTFRPFQSKTLHQHGADQSHFKHGEVLTDADPWARAKGHPCAAWDVWCTGQKALWLEFIG
jgi:hypothetical protein